jgi:hypothetical protein
MPFYVMQEALCPLQDYKATCLRILHDVLYFEKFNLRWVPHSLDSNQKAERVTLSHRLLEILEKDEENDFYNVLAGYEFWFYLEYSHESATAESRDEIPERIRQKINTEKCLISVI